MKIRKNVHVVILCFAMLFSQKIVRAQEWMAGMDLVNVDYDARSLALGGDVVALQGINAAGHLNPAVIGFPGELSFSIPLHTGRDIPVLHNRMQDYNPLVAYSKNHWTFSYELKFRDYGVNVNPNHSGTSEFEYHPFQSAHTLSAAYHLSDSFTAGLGINIINSKLYPTGISVGGNHGAKASGVSLNMGVLYHKNIKTTLFEITPGGGWSLTEFGPTIKYSGSSTREPLPMTMRAGVSVQASFNRRFKNRHFFSLGVFQNLSKLMLDKDLAKGDRPDPFHTLFNSWGSLPYYTGSEWIEISQGDQIRRHTGFELGILELLYLRYGMQRQSGVMTRVHRNFKGLGLHLPYVNLDYVSYRVKSEDPVYNNNKVYFFQVTGHIKMNELAKLLH